MVKMKIFKVVLMSVVLLFFLFACEDAKTMPKKEVDKDAVSEVDEENIVDKDAENKTDNIEEPDEVVDENDDGSDLDENVPPDIEQQEEDEIPDVDNWVAVDMCDVNTDCAWNYICDYFQTPRDCIKIGTCENDYDCPGLQKCTKKEHWNECVAGGIPETCSEDEDCDPGEFCEEINFIKVCRSKNKCSDNEECEEKEECIFEDGYFQCINTAPCEIDTDCKFGFRCEIKEPENECVYANECVKDDECNAFSACVVEGNYTICKPLGGGVCTDDNGCKIDEFCDLQLGLIGVCKSRNQCYKDEDCEDERLVCEFNGVYNDCVPSSPSWCLLDEMCGEGWYCIENECRPPNYDQCTEIAGKWTVRFSGLSLITFQEGEVYEFLPKTGCNGDIKKEGATIFLGSFTETSKSNYEFDFFLVYKCTTVIYLGNLMNITCPDGSAQLARF